MGEVRLGELAQAQRNLLAQTTASQSYFVLFIIVVLMYRVEYRGGLMILC
jgi:hypothetical protein